MAGLRIIVGIKQVPLVEDVNFDFESKTIRRDGPSVINAFDLRAIALAVDLNRRFGGETVAVTMGPPQAQRALEDALAMGINRAVHLQDPAFAGADTLATARTLALWLERTAFDLILLGKYALDAETGQVGPEIAELLGIAQITGVRSLRVRERTLHAERESDEGYDEVECELPALLTCAERLIKPIKLADDAAERGEPAAIEVLRAADLGADPGRVGLAGSPTWVGGIRLVEPASRRQRRIDGSDPLEAAQAIAALLNEPSYRNRSGEGIGGLSAGMRDSNPGKDVWIACEMNGAGKLSPVTLELATRGSEIASRVGGALVAVSPGEEALRHAHALGHYGVDLAFVLELAPEAARSPDSLAAAVATLVSRHRPWALLIPATEWGRDWAPRLAARLGLGLTGDAIGLEVDDDNRLVALKPAFGGNMVADILSRTYPQMATVRPGMLTIGAPASGRSAMIVPVRPEVGRPLSRHLRSHSELDRTITPLERADVIIGVGMGVGGPEGVSKVLELARATGGSVCATRRVADQGWLPRQLQVGLTGKGLKCPLYLAMGIRGSANHTVGLKGVGTVIAVNVDPGAPIFACADIGIVGDCVRILPLLLQAIHKRRRVGRAPNAGTASLGDGKGPALES